jgi:Mg2+/citrate symporter
MNTNNKNNIYKLIGIIVILGAIVPFAAQFLLPFFLPNSNVQVSGAEIWNQFVSIILGVIATITSIVSLILGFRSEERSNETEIRTVELLHTIEKKIELMSQKQDQLQSSLLKTYSESNTNTQINFSSGKSDNSDEQIN